MKFPPADYSPYAIVGNYRIDEPKKLRIEDYRGTVGLADLRAMMVAMASDPCWTADYHGLVDFSLAKLELTANDILRLALLMRQTDFRTTGWLVYVAPDSSTYGVIRMLGYWSRCSHRIRIFEDRQTADAWLEANRFQSPTQFVEDAPAIPRKLEKAVLLDAI